MAIDCKAEADRCHRSKDCASREIWGRVQKAVEGVLESTTLKDLVDMDIKKKKSVKKT